jgi:uncharacterized protein YbjT (DUF2867 family)
MSEENPIVVTGATGRLGSQVAEHLLSTGHALRAVARSAELLKPLGQRGVDVRPGSFHDRTFLTRAFRGAKAAFLLTPLDVSLPDLNAEQKTNVENIVAAIRDAGLQNVVLLSSWGAEVTERIGGIIGCHWFERLLEGLSGLNVVHLRPVWFMENFLWNIGLMKMAGINGLAIGADVRFPTVATRDIAFVAAEYLHNLDFKGRTIRYLNGPRDYTMTEVTRILGASIGKPDMKYIEFPESVLRRGLTESGGLSPNAADLLIEINRGIDSSRLHAEPRSVLNTTPTTLEEFARMTFAPAFKATPDVSFSGRFSGLFLRSFLFVSGHRAGKATHQPLHA